MSQMNGSISMDIQSIWGAAKKLEQAQKSSLKRFSTDEVTDTDMMIIVTESSLKRILTDEDTDLDMMTTVTESTDEDTDSSVYVYMKKYPYSGNT